MPDTPSIARRRVRSIRTFQAFYNPGYRSLWAGSFLSQVGRWIQVTLLSWLVLTLTDSPWQVALVGFFSLAPQPLLGLVGGVLADRVDRRMVLVSTQSANMLATAGLMALLLTDSAQYWHAYPTILVSGIGQSLDNPTRRSAMHDLVGTSGLTNAIALDTMAFNASRLVGPTVAGGLIALVDVSGGYVVVTALYTAAVMLMWSLRLSGGPGRYRGAESMIRNLVDGFRYVRGHTTILAALLVTAMMNLVVFSYFQMVPVIGRDTLGVGPGLIGVLMAADGVGGLVGAILVASAATIRYHGRVYMAGSALALVALLMFAISQWYLLSISLLVTLGLGAAGFGTMQATIVLLAAREDMRGRALGVTSLAIGSGPLGMLMVGGIASAVSPAFAVGLNAVIGLVFMGLIGLLMPSLWRQPVTRDALDPEPAADAESPGRSP